MSSVIGFSNANDVGIDYCIARQDHLLVKEMYFSYYREDYLPPQLAKFANLTKLSICHAANVKLSIKEFPKKFWKLTQMEEMRLDGLDMDTLPEEFAALQKLRRLDLWNCRFHRFPNAFVQMPNLQELHIYNSNTMPENWEALCHITTLTMDGIPHFPDSFWGMTQLKSAFLTLSTSQLPADIGRWTALHELGLFGGTLAQLPDVFDKMPHLRNVRICGHKQLTALPPSFSRLGKLEQVDFTNNNFAQLPDLQQSPLLSKLIAPMNALTDLPAWVTKLSQLEWLDLNFNQLTSIPSGFERLLQLKHINLSDNSLKTLPMELLYSDSLEELHISSGLSPNFRKHHRAFFEAIHKNQIPPEHRSSLYYLLCKAKKETPTIPAAGLLYAMKTNEKLLMEPALAEIERRYAESGKPLTKGCEVVVVGTVPFKKPEMKARLQQVGIYSPAKPTAKTTHVVVGKKVEDVAALSREGLVFLSAIDLDKFLKNAEEQYLIKNPETEIKETKHNLSELLLSPDQSNVQLGLEILKTGGVPKEIITELFLIAKNPNFDNKVRKQARQFLELNASAALIKNLNLKEQFLTPNYTQEKIQTNIRIHLKGTELDTRKIAFYMFAQQKNAELFYAETLSPEERVAYMRQKLAKERNAINLSESPFWLEYPDELVQVAADVYAFVAIYCGLSKFPAVICRLTALRHLNLSHNFFTAFPAAFVHLQALEELNIISTNIGSIPSYFYSQMPNLKIIRIDGTPIVYQQELPSPYEYKLLSDSRGWYLQRITEKQ